MATSGEKYVINGIKLFVPDAHVADYLMVVARTRQSAKPENGITVFLVDAKRPSIQYESQVCMGLDNKCEVVFESVVVSKANILGELNQGWKLVQSTLMKAAVALSCHQV